MLWRPTVFSRCICLSRLDCLKPHAVTPERTISGSYDWLRLGQGATDRQFLLRSPAAVACRDRSLRVVALSRTIGEYRWQDPSQEIVRLVVVINDWCTINRDGRRPMVRSIDRCIMLRPIVRAIVAPEYRWYNQSWDATIDRTINRIMVRPIVRSIVATYDRSYDHSWYQTIWNSRLQVLNMTIDRPCCDWFAPCDHPPLRPVVRPFYDLSTIQNYFGRSYVVTWS